MVFSGDIMTYYQLVLKSLLFVLLAVAVSLLNTQNIKSQPVKKDTTETIRDSYTIGDGFRFRSADNFFSSKLNLRFQNKFAYHQDLDGNDRETDLGPEIRRLRIAVGGHIWSEKLRYYIQHSLDRGNSRLFLAYTEYHPTPDLEFGFGQFTVDATRQFLTSSNNLGMVDRSIADKRFMLFFDLGAYIRYKKQLGNQVFKGAFNLTGGEGPNVDINPDGYNYIGRLDWLPLGSFKQGGDFVELDIAYEESPKVAFGSAISFNNNAVRIDGERGAFLFQQNTDITTYIIDGVFKYKGASLSFEYIDRTNNKVEFIDSNNEPFPIFEGEGYYVQAGKVINKKHAFVARVSRIQPSHRIQEYVGESISTTQTKALGGYTRFLKGHDLKWQIDAGVVFKDDHISEVDHQLVIRTQIHINL